MYVHTNTQTALTRLNLVKGNAVNGSIIGMTKWRGGGGGGRADRYISIRITRRWSDLHSRPTFVTGVGRVGSRWAHQLITSSLYCFTTITTQLTSSCHSDRRCWAPGVGVDHRIGSSSSIWNMKYVAYVLFHELTMITSMISFCWSTPRIWETKLI